MRSANRVPLLSFKRKYRTGFRETTADSYLGLVNAGCRDCIG